MHRIHRLWHLVGIVALLSMLVAGGTAAAKSLQHRSPALINVKLQLKWVAQSQFAGYFVAADKGFYRQQGLNVTILNGGPQVTPETVVAAHGADFGIDWMASLLHSREQGLPIVNIAQIYQASGMRMISFKSSGINSVRKFVGHTVGVWPAGNQYQFFALMHKDGYHCSIATFNCTGGIKVVQEGFSMDPFLNHQLDVSQAMTYNELGVVLEHGIPRSRLNILDYNKLGVSMLEDGIFARSDWLKSHRQIAIKFLRASIMGWQWTVQHPTAAGQLTFKHIPAGSATQFHMIYQAKEVAKLVKYHLNGHFIGWMNPAAFSRTWHEAKLDAVISKAPRGAYDQSYWKAAVSGMSMHM